jgi:hypothetical protein
MASVAHRSLQQMDSRRASALVSTPPRSAIPARLAPNRVMQNPGSRSTGRGATAFGAG